MSMRRALTEVKCIPLNRIWRACIAGFIVDCLEHILSYLGQYSTDNRGTSFGCFFFHCQNDSGMRRLGH